MAKFESDLTIPDADVARQALGAIQGYQYQLYATAYRWASLTDREVLLVEVAEDYAVLAEGALVAVQVKSTAGSGSVTLRTKGVLDLINAFWRLKTANSTLAVRATYLTTSTIGHEQGQQFPDGVAGLQYWRVAAREGSEIAPLRKFLATLPLHAELAQWLVDAADEDVRTQLLHLITWECGAPPFEQLDELLKAQLFEVGEAYGLLPSDVSRVRDALVIQVLAIATKSGQRQLNRQGLFKVIERAGTISVSVHAIRRLIAGSVNPNGAEIHSLANATAVSSIPHGPGAVARIAVRKEIEARLKSAAAVWLYGSSGDGKTTLALETARASNRTWSIIELRECDPQTVLKRLRDARHCVSEPSFGGIILDDLPLAALGRAKLELSILAEAVRRSDGVLVCTAYLQPPPSFDVGSFSPSVMKAPYLTDDEVSAMILASGGDAKLWTPLIQLSCHNGHPQLVAARVSGLRSRIGHRGKDWRALLHQCRSLILTPSVMLYEVVC